MLNNSLSDIYKISDIVRSEHINLSAGGFTNVTLTFNLSEQPTFARFVPTVFQWLGPDAGIPTISIVGTTVTVNYNVDCYFTSPYCMTGGFLIYK